MLKELLKEAEFFKIAALAEAIRATLVPQKPTLSQQEVDSRLQLSEGSEADETGECFETQYVTGAMAVFEDVDLSNLSFTEIYFEHGCSFSIEKREVFFVLFSRRSS